LFVPIGANARTTPTTADNYTHERSHMAQSLCLHQVGNKREGFGSERVRPKGTNRYVGIVGDRSPLPRCDAIETTVASINAPLRCFVLVAPITMKAGTHSVVPPVIMDHPSNKI
jgi:hypothetical protein